MKYTFNQNELYISFYDEFDSLKIRNIKNQVLSLLNSNSVNKVYFDFNNVSFIDSTGIGFVLARYRDLNKVNIALSICNLKKELKILFDMSGVFQIIQYEEKKVKL